MNRYVQLRNLFVVAATLLAGDAAAQSQPAEGPRSVLEGAYTTAQATRGKDVFRNTCGNCHSSSQFIGPSFEVVWAGRAVFDLFDQLRGTMPLDNPGGLSRQEYAAVIAYILTLNDFPAGETPLPDDDAGLKQIRFDRKPAAGAKR